MQPVEITYKPLYRQIYDVLYDRITSSYYEKGEDIPSEKELASEFNVSISTIRQAVGLLVEQGLLLRKQGRGTFVTDNPISVKFFGWIGESQKGETIIQEIIRNFEKKNPNLNIEYINSTYENIKNEYIELVQSGNPPDIVQIDNYWTSSLASMGLLEPLDRRLSEKNISDRNVALDLDGGKYNNTLFSVAWGLGPSALIYNKKLVERFEIDLSRMVTLEDFTAVCDKIKRHPLNNGESAFGLAKNIDIIYNIYPFVSAFNAQIINSENEITIDHNNMKEFFRWIKAIANDTNFIIGKDLRELRRFLIEDKLVFLQDGPWIGGILKDETGYQNIEEHFGVMVNPTRAGSRHSSFTRNHSLAISSFSAKKDVAAKFIDAITSDPEVYGTYFKDTGLIPPIRKCELNHLHDNDIYMNSFSKQLEKSELLNSSHPFFEKALMFAADAALNILFQNANIEEELEEKAYYLSMLYKD